VKAKSAENKTRPAQRRALVSRAMKRLLTLVIAAAAVLALCAGPASAEQALKLGKGPPTLTGDFDGNGALVFHCNPFIPGEGPGAAVFTPTGAIRGNCS
jgi:hypothetical protein